MKLNNTTNSFYISSCEDLYKFWRPLWIKFEVHNLISSFGNPDLVIFRVFPRSGCFNPGYPGDG